MLAIYSQRALSHGGRAFAGEDSSIRAYRATTSRFSMLAKDGLPDHRIDVDLGGH